MLIFGLVTTLSLLLYLLEISVDKVLRYSELSILDAHWWQGAEICNTRAFISAWQKKKTQIVSVTHHTHIGNGHTTK